MCLITEQQEPLVAKRKIPIVKELTHSRRSPYADNPIVYEPNVLYSVKMEKTDDPSPFDGIDQDYWMNKFRDAWNMNSLPNGVVSIGPGFHCAKPNRLLNPRYYNVFKGEIPKGSLYYRNPTGLYVSNQIIIY